MGRFINLSLLREPYNYVVVWFFVGLTFLALAALFPEPDNAI